MTEPAMWHCSFCDVDVEIPAHIAMAFFTRSPAEGLAAIRAEQGRHLAQCEPYLRRLGSHAVATAEAMLREAVSHD